MEHNDKQTSLASVIKSLGLVFGDIGTSPIYTLTVIFLLLEKTVANVVGVLSLIVWTLAILVSVAYAWLAMGLGKKGEGGTIVLREILISLLRSSRGIAFVTLLSFIGISLLVGDGVITPAISILSAVEGVLLIPGFEQTGHETLLAIAGGIAVLLFVVQSKGTERVAAFFGPLMVVWFLALSVSGIAAITEVPEVLKALNPMEAYGFLKKHGLAGFFVLSEVILCATGGEALYADMGHLGREPILRAWHFVFVALVLNYLGQGAFLAQHPEAKNVLFEMIFSQARILYVPFLLMSIMATVIASQAMISGMFSIFFQGITTHILPLMRVDYTSKAIHSQIYIASVNWFLLASVLFIMAVFGESSKLAAAYGLAVTGTMTLTGFMMIWIFSLRGNFTKALISVLVTVIDCAYLAANTMKIPHGGYWSLIIASLPLALILLYTAGQRRLANSHQPMDLDVFLEKYKEVYNEVYRIRGTGLFFARDIAKIPAYIPQTMFVNNIVYSDNIIVSLNRRDEPFGVNILPRPSITEGLRALEIEIGYMEVVDVEELLRDTGIREKVIFYGIDDIRTRNLFWKTFSLIKRLTPAYVQFLKLPPEKLHGVMTRVEM